MLLITSVTNKKLELDAQRRALYASASWALDHAVTLTFDLFSPKTEAFILVPKYVNHESLVKFGPVIFKTTRQQGQKVHFSACPDPIMTLNFDLLIPKLEAFVLVSKSPNAECLVKICPIL